MMKSIWQVGRKIRIERDMGNFEKMTHSTLFTHHEAETRK